MTPSVAISVYVHWPFCLARCPYCDFNAHVRPYIDQSRWKRAYLREIDTLFSAVKGGLVTSVFFGGGTPSLMAPETVWEILERLQKTCSWQQGAEVTLEANPTSVETDKLRALHQAGVTRLSLGVQSFDEGALRFLGRCHSVREARKAIDIASKCYSSYSFDLIYARPDQTVTTWARELQEALVLSRDHLSLYQLTVEPGTEFHKNRILLPPERMKADLYQKTESIMKDHGFYAYEVSNYARPGSECRHNLNCWEGGNYIGIGPGAHGRLGRRDEGSKADQSTSDKNRAVIACSTINWRQPEKWLKAVEKTGHGQHKNTFLSVKERSLELLMLGLRLDKGVKAQTFFERTGQSLSGFLNQVRLKALIEEGLVHWEGDALKTTFEGRMKLDGVLGHLLS